MSNFGYQPYQGFNEMDPSQNAKKVAEEIEKINRIVTKYFPVYDVRVGQNALVIRCKVNEDGLDDTFDLLKNDLYAINYIPMLTKDGDETILLVTKKPFARYRGLWLNISLLVFTIITTILAGAWSYAMFDGKATIRLEDTSKLLSIFVDPHYLLFGGLFFALPLMLILGIHELGHYFMSRRLGVKASLPFFIPFPPPISPLGTMGALISIREPIPNNKALLDIGVAGPICGFIVAIPVTILGLFLTVSSAHPFPADVTKYYIPGDSILYYLMALVFPSSNGYMLHPLAFAGWVGLLVTGLNLLPVGQLDGGHIAQALLGSKAKYLSYTMAVVMLAMGLFFSTSWLLFAFLIILMGLRHPPPLNDLTKLDTKRKAVGVFAIVLLIMCITPNLIVIQDGTYDVSVANMIDEPSSKIVFINSTAEFNFTVTNIGTTSENVTVSGTPPMTFPPWSDIFHNYGGMTNSSTMSFNLDVGVSRNITMIIYIPNNTTFTNKSYPVIVDVKVTDTSINKHLTFMALVSKDS